ncbi:hypothetical protein DPMN_137914 [Dreissena polymorpha]|uniref:Uncharacterized protein n=1 Tax=Dreissena polymorpha TaxID=45954 RepID=A0A9D4JE46_DREPO|nr:hypothetical protein DPMN_137914 [Dreissena polymorpha]
MEWAIMNFGGLNGLMGTLGYVEEDQYIVDDDCLACNQFLEFHPEAFKFFGITGIGNKSLEMMLCQLEEDDPMANSNIIQKWNVYNRRSPKVTNIDLPWVEEKIISDRTGLQTHGETDSIKTCLVLLRNLLHVPSTQTDGGQNDIHLAFLR